MESTAFLKPLLPEPGVLTFRAPNESEAKDIEYGRRIAREIARMDIGQSVVVRDQACVAVEAMEGTDDVIRRAASLAGHQPITVVKVSKPEQDMRFDVPVVGLPTVELMAQTNATALAIDAHKTLLIDREKVIAFADAHQISIVACGNRSDSICSCLKPKLPSSESAIWDASMPESFGVGLCRGCRRCR